MLKLYTGCDPNQVTIISLVLLINDACTLTVISSYVMLLAPTCSDIHMQVLATCRQEDYTWAFNLEKMHAYMVIKT